MSQTPMHIDGLTARWGAALGKGMKAEDALWAGLTDSYTKQPMGKEVHIFNNLYNTNNYSYDVVWYV